MEPFEDGTFHIVRDIGHDRFKHEDMLVAQYDYKGETPLTLAL